MALLASGRPHYPPQRTHSTLMPMTTTIYAPEKECSYAHCRLTFASDADRRWFDGGRSYRGSPGGGDLTLP